MSNNIQIAFWGTKRGVSVFFNSPGLSVEKKDIKDAFFDIRAAVRLDQPKVTFYSIRFTAEYKIYTQYRFLYDWLGREGFVAISLFIPKGEKLPEEQTLKLLNRLLEEYSSRYVENLRISAVREDERIFFNIVSEYQTASTAESTCPVSSSGGLALIRYNKDDLSLYFDNPFNKKYNLFSAVVFIDSTIEQDFTSMETITVNPYLKNIGINFLCEGKQVNPPTNYSIKCGNKPISTENNSIEIDTREKEIDIKIFESEDYKHKEQSWKLNEVQASIDIELDKILIINYKIIFEDSTKEVIIHNLYINGVLNSGSISLKENFDPKHLTFEISDQFYRLTRLQPEVDKDKGIIKLQVEKVQQPKQEDKSQYQHQAHQDQGIGGKLPPPRPKKEWISIRTIIIFAGIVLVIALGVIIYILLMKNSAGTVKDPKQDIRDTIYFIVPQNIQIDSLERTSDSTGYRLFKKNELPDSITVKKAGEENKQPLIKGEDGKCHISDFKTQAELNEDAQKEEEAKKAADEQKMNDLKKHLKLIDGMDFNSSSLSAAKKWIQANKAFVKENVNFDIEKRITTLSDVYVWYKNATTDNNEFKENINWLYLEKDPSKNISNTQKIVFKKILEFDDGKYINFLTEKNANKGKSIAHVLKLMGEE